MTYSHLESNIGMNPGDGNQAGDDSPDRPLETSLRRSQEGVGPIASKDSFLFSLRTRLENGNGFAAGKLGTSQQHWMVYPVLLERAANQLGVRLFEHELLLHGLKNAGIFPASPDFYLRFNRFYLEHVRNLDSVGVFLNGNTMERVIVRHYDLENLIHYQDQEPDRSVPDNPDRCYLPFLRGKRILIICPFARLLKERASQETFEATWARTGKQWFYPAGVDALEFPYGFSRRTQSAYGTAFDLFDDILRAVEERDFDVALIGAAGLAVPIASSIKRMGKVALDLGGHLQVLFGVAGRRWREQEEWRTTYFNTHWIDMPEEYRPEEDDVCDRGAYW